MAIKKVALTLTPAAFDVLRRLVEFHKDDNTGEYYDAQGFRDLEEVVHVVAQRVDIYNNLMKTGTVLDKD